MKKRKQSMSGIIRERLAAIEERLALGVMQETIVEELAQEGHFIAITNFRSELWRARQRRKKNLLTTPIREGGQTTKQAVQNTPKTGGKEVATTNAENPPENPLRKATGFNYGGTVKADDLI